MTQEQINPSEWFPFATKVLLYEDMQQAYVYADHAISDDDVIQAILEEAPHTHYHQWTIIERDTHSSYYRHRWVVHYTGIAVNFGRQ